MINAGNTEILSSNVKDYYTAVSDLGNFSDETKNIINDHIRLYQVLHNGFEKLKIDGINEKNLTATAQEDTGNLISDYFNFSRLIHNITSFCNSSKTLYDIYTENCSNIEHDLVEESSLDNKCSNVLKKMIKNISKKISNYHAELKRTRENIISTHAKIISHIEKNNFKQMAVNKITDLNARISDEENKIDDAMPDWNKPWLDIKAMAQAKSKRMELLEKSVILNEFFNILKDCEQLIQKVEKDLKKVSENEAQAFNNMNKILE